MKITLNKKKPERKLVALISTSGCLLMPFKNNMLLEQKTVSLGHKDCVVICNGTHTIGQILGDNEFYTKVYEGDSVTIQF